MKYIYEALLCSLLSLGILGISLGENNHRNVVSREEFEDLKRLVQILYEKVEVQQKEINDLKRDVKEKDELIEKIATLSIEQLVNRDIRSVREPSVVKKNGLEEHSSVDINRKYSRIVPAPTESVVAFYAYMSGNENSPSVHHTLIYDHEVTNIGHGYSKHSGIFTAPVDGVYVFAWNTFTVTSGQYMSIEITLNSQPVGATFPEGGGDYAGVTGIVVLSVQRNDVIYTRTHTTYVPVGSIRSDNLMRSTFSGWCLSCH
ncbi:complement C1q-like protein 4 [Saccostrea cucullata]|uniref:complement C1q-like protein 4 n=1 Tax=Saccostrea cuccullata TaxID=36930 RepID=UPI002ED05DE6